MKKWKKKIRKSLVLGLAVVLLGNVFGLPSFAMAPSENEETVNKEDSLEETSKKTVGMEEENKEAVNEDGSGTNGNANENVDININDDADKNAGTNTDDNIDGEADSEDGLHEQEAEEEQKEAEEEQTEQICEPEQQRVLETSKSQLESVETMAKNRASGITYGMVKIGTADNYKDAAETVTVAIGGGTATWEPDTATLTLENVKASESIVINTAGSASATVTVRLKGKNEIDITQYDDGTALLSNEDLVINAEEGAELNITAMRENAWQIGIQSLKSVTINGGAISVKSKFYTIYGAANANINGGTLDLRSVDDAAIYGNSAVNIAGGKVMAESANSVAISSNGDIRIMDGADVELKSKSNAMYSTGEVNITGGSVTAESEFPAIYSVGTINISGETVAKLKASYNAIYGETKVNITGGNVTAESAGRVAIFANDSIRISGEGTEVNARGYYCALRASNGIEISNAELIGHSIADHVVYTANNYITIKDRANVTLTSDWTDAIGLFLNNTTPLMIADSTVTITTNSSSIVSLGDVSIRDSKLTLKSPEGNGIIASTDSGEGTLTISGDNTYIECESLSPLYGGRVVMEGGYLDVIVSEGPAVSGMKGITINGGEVHAKAVGTSPSFKPAAFYSSQGNILFIGENTQIEAISEHYRAVYTENAEKGEIILAALVTAKSGGDFEAITACSNETSNEVPPDPDHGIVIGEGYSAQGYLPVTTKWMEYRGTYTAYTVLAPIGTENLQESYYQDLPSEVHIVPAVYEISAAPGELDFGSKAYGAPVPEAKTVTVTNTGNMLLTLSTPNLEKYTVQTASDLKLAPGKSAVFTIQPKSALVPGSHEEAITFSTDRDGVTGEAEAAFTVNKAVPVITAAPTAADRRYNPSAALGSIALTGGAVIGVDNNLLTGSWSWKDGSAVPGVGSKKYVAVFTPDRTNCYETANADVFITVTKAVPYIAGLPQAASITYGDTLGSSALSGGSVLYGDGTGQAGGGIGSTEAVAGTFTWREPSQKPAAADSGTTKYEVVFTPSDGVNYDTVYGEVTLTVQKAPNAPNMPEDAIDVARRFEKAGDVPLPEGWEWQESDRETALAIGVPVTAVAVYTGADKGNYEKETVTITLTRSDCDHTAGEILYTRDGEKAPTCTESGLGHRECGICHIVMETEVEAAPLGHSYAGRVTKEPTASSEGVRTYTCSRCGHQYTESIAKLPSGNNSQSGNDSSGNSQSGSQRTDSDREKNLAGKEAPQKAGQPFIKGEGRKEGWDVIRAEENEAIEGSTIHIDMNGAFEVPGDIFDRLKGRDITITFDMGDGILWSVDGKSILADQIEDIDLSVKTNTNGIPVDVMDRVTGERFGIQVQLAYEGEFGFTAILSINLGSERTGMYANLFYYNQTTGELEFMAADEIAEDGTAELSFTHASDYAIVIDTKPMDQAEEADDITQTEETNRDGMPDDTRESGAAKEDSFRYIWILVICGVLALAGLGAFLVSGRRNIFK